MPFDASPAPTARTAACIQANPAITLDADERGLSTTRRRSQVPAVTMGVDRGDKKPLSFAAAPGLFAPIGTP